MRQHDIATAVPRAAMRNGSRRVLRWLQLLLVCLLAGCASAPERSPGGGSGPHAAKTEAANAVLFRAIGLVGTPYRYGGNTPQGGFDCSGLVGYVYRDAAGLALPRTTGEIAGLDAPKVKRGQLAPGDLVFFGQRGRVNHVGIYVGEGRFVHAPNRGGTVRIDPLDGHYWRDAWLFGKRLLR